MRLSELKQIIRECIDEVYLNEGGGSRRTKRKRQQTDAGRYTSHPHDSVANVRRARKIVDRRHDSSDSPLFGGKNNTPFARRTSLNLYGGIKGKSLSASRRLPK